MNASGTRRILAFIFCLFLLVPAPVFAHAVLLNENPQSGSRLEAAPSQISLVFNERVENEQFFLNVLDQKGQAVTTEPASLVSGQKELTVPVPSSLGPGIYTVTYKVISDDGHPVTGSYAFTIGPAGTDGGAADKTNAGEGLPPSSGGSGNAILSTAAYAFRMLYYFTLLVSVGWILWMTAARSEDEAVRRTDTGVSRRLGWILPAVVLSWISLQLPGLLNSWSLSDAASFFTGTRTGISLLLLLLLSLAGTVVLRRNRWLDRAWAAGLLLLESLNGHAMAFGPRFLSIAGDWIHLAAAALWAGGLLYLAIHRKNGERTRRFLPIFSRTALVSMAALVLSGAALTVLFLPKLNDLFHSPWGILLLVKTGLVVGVLAAGAGLRSLIRSSRPRPDAFRTLFRLDFGLMLLIVGIVGVFTFLSPLPQNKPLVWQQTASGVSLTANVSPKAPGNNKISVTVGLDNSRGTLKKVEMSLYQQKSLGLAPVSVPLHPEPDTGKIDSSGRNLVTYASAAGPYLPFPGEWEIVVWVTDGNDEETVFHTTTTVY